MDESCTAAAVGASAASLVVLRAQMTQQMLGLLAHKPHFLKMARGAVAAIELPVCQRLWRHKGHRLLCNVLERRVTSDPGIVHCAVATLHRLSTTDGFAPHPSDRERMVQVLSIC